MNLFALDKPFATSLARGLLLCVTTHNRADDWRLREIPYDFRIYPSVCISLWKLGLAQISNGKSNFLPPFNPNADDQELSQLSSRIFHDGPHKAKFISEDEIESKIDFSHWGEVINSKILLQQFLLCMVKIGVTEKLPASRKSNFIVKDQTLRVAMLELVANGYAIPSGEAFQWTDKVATFMLENYLWTQDEIIRNRIDNNLISKSLKNLISTSRNKLPHFSTPNISSCTAFGASIALLKHWDGTTWQDDPLDEPKISFETAIGISSSFLKEYESWRYRGKDIWRIKTPQHLTDDEKRLVTSLAKVVHIWWEACSLKDPHPNEKHEQEPPGYVYHHHDSTFEHSGDILWKLGLANAGWHTHGLFDVSYDKYKDKYANPQDLSFPVVFKPVPKHEIDEKIVFHNFYPSLSIFKVLRSFLELASDFGGSLCLDRYSPFSAPNSDLAQALEVLVEFGYAERSELNYVWRDKISVAMISGYDWTEDDFNPDGVYRPLVEEVLSVLQTMDKKLIPRFIADGYLGKHTDTVLGFAFGLLRHWSGGKWSKDLNAEPSMTMDTAIKIAREFLDKYKHNDDYLNHNWVRV